MRRSCPHCCESIDALARTCPRCQGTVPGTWTRTRSVLHVVANLAAVVFFLHVLTRGHQFSWNDPDVELDDLQLVVETREGRPYFVVLGHLDNRGGSAVAWPMVDLQLLDADGRFVDSLSGEIYVTVPGRQRVSFRVEGPATTTERSPLSVEGRVLRARVPF
ncbi:MAG: hypothetical protein AAF533_02205 [Acidobacteriota bacterium]